MSNSISTTSIPLFTINSLSCSDVASFATPVATKLTLAARIFSTSSLPVLAFPKSKVEGRLDLLLFPVFPAFPEFPLFPVFPALPAFPLFLMFSLFVFPLRTYLL